MHIVCLPILGPGTLLMFGVIFEAQKSSNLCPQIWLFEAKLHRSLSKILTIWEWIFAKLGKIKSHLACKVVPRAKFCDWYSIVHMTKHQKKSEGRSWGGHESNMKGCVACNESNWERMRSKRVRMGNFDDRVILGNYLCWHYVEHREILGFIYYKDSSMY